MDGEREPELPNICPKCKCPCWNLPNQADMERELVLFPALIHKVVHIRSYSSGPLMEPLDPRNVLPWQSQNRGVTRRRSTGGTKYGDPVFPYPLAWAILFLSGSG
jgi:hypothetical protein